MHSVGNIAAQRTAQFTAQHAAQFAAQETAHFAATGRHICRHSISIWPVIVRHPGGMNSASAKTEVQSALASIVETFKPSGPWRFKNLSPFKEEIRELRSRGAAFITIAEILKKHSVKTSRETVRRFYRETFREKHSRRSGSRSGGKRSQPTRKQRTETSEANPPQSSTGKTERGPRIARIEDL